MKNKQELNDRLLQAAEQGDVAGIKDTLLAGADPNAGQICETEIAIYMETNALMLACLAGPAALEGIQALIKAGANVHTEIDGKNAMVCAATGASFHPLDNAEPVIDALVAAGAKVDKGKWLGLPPIYHTCISAEKMSLSALKAFLKHGVNPNIKPNDRTDLLTVFTWECPHSTSAIEAAMMLIEAGAYLSVGLNPVERIYDTPLGAATYCWPELVEYYLEQGANPDIIDKEGLTLEQDVSRRHVMLLVNDHDFSKEAEIAELKTIHDLIKNALEKLPDGKGKIGSTPVNPYSFSATMGLQ